MLVDSNALLVLYIDDGIARVCSLTELATTVPCALCPEHYYYQPYT